MSMRPTSADIESPDELLEREPAEVVRTSLIRGAAILIPLAVTLAVFGFVLDFISGLLNPVVIAVEGLPMLETLVGGAVIKVLAAIGIVGLVLVVGFLAEYRSESGKLGQSFDQFMVSIPGLGSVYRSFNQMSELLLESETDSFQEVRLVEYPTPGSYVIAFKTAETPTVIAEATANGEMVTLFMPMAPNPVMGGFVVHVPEDRVVDVDLTVEEGIRAIVTSGVAVGGNNHGESTSEVGDLGRLDDPTDGGPRDDGPDDGAR